MNYELNVDFVLSFSQSMPSKITQQDIVSDDVWKSLVKHLILEMNLSKSEAWDLFINEFESILSGKGIDPLKFRSRITKRNLSELSNTTRDIMFYSIRYHDFLLHSKVKLRSEISQYQLRSEMIASIIANRVVVRQSFEKEYVFDQLEGYNTAVYHPFLHTFLSIENKTLEFIPPIYAVLCIAHHVWKNRSSFLICLVILHGLYHNELSLYFQKMSKSQLCFSLSQSLEILQKTFLHSTACMTDWNLDIEKIAHLLRSLPAYQFAKNEWDAMIAENIGDTFQILLLGKVALLEARITKAGMYFTHAFKRSSSLLATGLSLRYLSGLFYDDGQYVASLRLLNTAYKRCTMYEIAIFPSFVNKQYFEKRKKIKKNIRNMVCCFCERKSRKLMCCTGCMEATYCSKSCQKRDWRSNHRRQCGKGRWSGFYEHVKQQLSAT